MKTEETNQSLPPTSCSAARELADCHEMLAQMASDEGEREDAQSEMEVANTIRSLVATLEDANSLCRSAMQITKRSGLRTDWNNFEKRLEASLERQHRVMFPSQNASGLPPATNDQTGLNE